MNGMYLFNVEITVRQIRQAAFLTAMIHLPNLAIPDFLLLCVLKMQVNFNA